jgi:hypothetical protein
MLISRLQNILSAWGWVANLVAYLLVTANSLGSNPDSPKISQMGDISKGVASTHSSPSKTYKKIQKKNMLYSVPLDFTF